MASARLRGLIPAIELQRMGHEVSSDIQGPVDWLILSKHDWPQFEIHARKVCFDVCDDHLDGEHGAHYRHWIEHADLVTCNSREMQRILWERCHRHAVVIDDPYESAEALPKCHAPVLWFGAGHNLVDLIPIATDLPDLVVVSDTEGTRVTKWSPAAMKEAWKTCGLVVLPTGERQAKSANRALEAIRNGCYPVCGFLPAYAELGLGVKDVATETWARLEDPEGTIEEVRRLQGVIRHRFSPETVGQAWANALTL